LRQKTLQKQGFIGSKAVTLPTFHHFGIAVEQELDEKLFGERALNRKD
jgi:hypothetical protein